MASKTVDMSGDEGKPLGEIVTLRLGRAMEVAAGLEAAMASEKDRLKDHLTFDELAAGMGEDVDVNEVVGIFSRIAGLINLEVRKLLASFVEMHIARWEAAGDKTIDSKRTLVKQINRLLRLSGAVIEKKAGPIIAGHGWSGRCFLVVTRDRKDGAFAFQDCKSKKRSKNYNSLREMMPFDLEAARAEELGD